MYLSNCIKYSSHYILWLALETPSIRTVLSERCLHYSEVTLYLDYPFLDDQMLFNNILAVHAYTLPATHL